MWLTPSSMARRNTASAVPRSRGGPQTPGPGSCMAPKPTRATCRPARKAVPPGGISVLLWDIVSTSFADASPTLSVTARKVAQTQRILHLFSDGVGADKKHTSTGEHRLTRVFIACVRESFDRRTQRIQLQRRERPGFTLWIHRANHEERFRRPRRGWAAFPWMEIPDAHRRE